MKENKSLGQNFIFNMLKAMMKVVFPLITFPYTTRVLGAAYLGRIDYAQANVTYFTLIGAFGVAAYAIREGARIRDDRDKFEAHACDMLTINFVSVIVAYVLFAIFLLLPKFSGYRMLMTIISSSIILTAVGVEWVFNIYEEYRYITIRSFIVQVISIVLLVTLVRKRSDYLIYVFILILSSVGANLFNFMRSRRYVHWRLRFHKGLLRHIRPMAYFFAMTIASTIYLTMDRSMLGYITGDDTEVGYYAAAIKILTVLTSIVTAFREIMLSRVAYHMGHDEKKAEDLNYFAVKAAILFAVPTMFGVFLLSKNILVFLSGVEYIPAVLPLKILIVDFFFAAANGMIVNQVFVVHRKEKWATIAVVMGAVSNVCINAVLIPLYGKEGAAVATVISEMLVFITSCVIGRSVFQVKRILEQSLQSFAASFTIVGVYYLITEIFTGDLLVIALTIIGSVVTYFGVLLLFRNEFVLLGIRVIKDKIG